LIKDNAYYYGILRQVTVQRVTEKWTGFFSKSSEEVWSR